MGPALRHKPAGPTTRDSIPSPAQVFSRTARSVWLPPSSRGTGDKTAEQPQ